MSNATPAQVTDQQPPVITSGSSHTRPTFGIACWLLALIAFVQLITVGTALTVRRESTPIVKEDKPTPPQVNTPQAPIQPRSIEEILASVGGGTSSLPADPIRVPATGPDYTPGPQALAPTPHSTIANPRVERLVQESRQLQLEGDMMRAMLKLDEATRLDPSEPAVIYHKALLFEEMSIYPKAANHYQQIQQIGIKAGNYYRLASAKLIKGMRRGIQKSALVIGPLKSRKATGRQTGKHVDVSITLLARPDKQVHAQDVEVQVHFYDRVNGTQIKKADTTATITPVWADNKVDWQEEGNEETLNVAYTIPEADPTDVHLLGKREYYGYVVELLYKGEVIDQQAKPRRLHSIHGANTPAISGAFPDDLIDQFPLGLPDDGGQLLPTIDDSYGDNPSRPPLPTR